MDDEEAIRAELFRKIEALAVSPESYTDLTDDLVVQAKGSADALDRFEASASRDLARALDQATLLQQREGPGRTAMANLRLSTSPAYLIRADGVIIGSNEAA